MRRASKKERLREAQTQARLRSEVLLTAIGRAIAGESVDHAMENLPFLRFPEEIPPALSEAIPTDLHQLHWQEFLVQIAPDARELLDFGCGHATRRDEVQQLGPRWWGLDIPHSQEARARGSNEFVTLYGGTEIPFRDGTFDAVISVQTFEHVPDPKATLSEIARILRAGGHLLGSTSNMEAFHSSSTYGYTPHWFAALLRDAGMAPIAISAGIDAVTLLARRMARQFLSTEEVKRFGEFFHAGSPLNEIINRCGTRQEVDPVRINALKLEVAGHFHFLARKGESLTTPARR